MEEKQFPRIPTTKNLMRINAREDVLEKIHEKEEDHFGFRTPKKKLKERENE